MTKNGQRMLLGGGWVLIGLLSIGLADNPWPGIGMIVLGVVLVLVYAQRAKGEHTA